MHVELDVLPLNLRGHIRLISKCHESAHSANISVHEFRVLIARVVRAHTRAVVNHKLLIPKCQTDNGQKALSFCGPNA